MKSYELTLLDIEYGMLCRGGTRISGKGAHMYKDVGVRFADFS